jgi:hypothetical protein
VKEREPETLENPEIALSKEDQIVWFIKVIKPYHPNPFENDVEINGVMGTRFGRSFGNTKKVEIRVGSN